MEIISLVPPPREVTDEKDNLKIREPSSISSDIVHLKEWLSKQPHLPQDIEERWLISFLQGCKYSLEKCKKKIENFFSLRTAVPDLFSNRDPTSEEIRNTVKSYAQIILPIRHPSNYFVIFGKIVNPDASIFCFESLIRKASITAESAIRECDTHDLIGIVDCEGCSLQHVLKISPATMRIVVKYVEDALPFSIKGIYVLNTKPFVQVLINMIWPLLPEKLKQKVHFLQDNLEELDEFVPRELLPLEYGGKAGTVEELNAETQRKLETYRDYFLKDAEKKTNESKRVRGINSYYDLCGCTDGSFRKLDID